MQGAAVGRLARYRFRVRLSRKSAAPRRTRGASPNEAF